MQEDLLALETTNGLWKDRVAWRARILVADPNNNGNKLWG